MMNIGIQGKLNEAFDQSIEMIMDGLKEQGFGIVSRIDMHTILKEKIEVDFRQYSILGACNAHFAHQALVSDSLVGLLLPCNVTVEELAENEIRVSFINPVEMLSLRHLEKNKEIAELANEVQKRLGLVANKLFS